VYFVPPCPPSFFGTRLSPASAPPESTLLIPGVFITEGKILLWTRGLFTSFKIPYERILFNPRVTLRIDIFLSINGIYSTSLFSRSPASPLILFMWLSHLFVGPLSHPPRRRPSLYALTSFLSGCTIPPLPGPFFFHPFVSRS